MASNRKPARADAFSRLKQSREKVSAFAGLQSSVPGTAILFQIVFRDVIVRRILKPDTSGRFFKVYFGFFLFLWGVDSSTKNWSPESIFRSPVLEPGACVAQTLADIPGPIT